MTQAVLMNLFRTTELEKQNPFEAVLAPARQAIACGKNAQVEFKLAA